MSPPPPEGWPQALGRRFHPEATLGKGAFGAVFRVRDASLGTPLAVKVLTAPPDRGLPGFKREFRALADLSHDNLVRLLELGCEGEAWFLAMELVEGRHLLEALDGQEERRLRSAFGQVALGLSRLHRANLLHRDLKPSNVLLTAAGRAVVLDFGLSADRGAPAEGGLVGTVRYLSPEQAQGLPATAASDVFALGVMLYEALAGRPPWDGTPREVLWAKRTRDAAPPSEARPGVAADLELLCLAMLARDPAHRPSAEAAVHALAPELAPLLELAPEAPFVGRGAALAELEAAFAATQPPSGLPEATGPNPVCPSGVEDPRSLSGHDRSRTPSTPLGLNGSGPVPLPAAASEPRRPVAVWLHGPPEAPFAATQPPSGLPETTRPNPVCPSGVEDPRSLSGHDRSRAPSTPLGLNGSGPVPLPAAASEPRRPVAVWLHGAPGQGKSTLVRQFLEARRRAGPLLVLASRCFEQESVPFGAVDGVVDGLARWLGSLPEAALEPAVRAHAARLARAFPALAAVHALDDDEVPALPEESRLRALAGAFRGLVAFAASRVPLVLWLDDLQWGDVDSLPLLAELLRPPSPPPLLLLASYRRDEAAHQPLLQGLRGLHFPQGTGAEERELSLDELSPVDAAALVRGVLGPQAPADQVAAVVAEGRGNPFLLQEFAGLAFTGSLPADGDEPLAAALARRVERLPPAARRLLTTVCCYAGPMPRPLAARASGAGHDEPLAVSHLRAARLLRARGSREGAPVLEPYHDRVRETLVPRLPADTARAAHAGIGDALLASGSGDDERLATHLAAGGREVEAASWAVRAADRASGALAFHHAAGWYRRALEWHRALPHRHQVEIALAEALAQTGRGEEAAQAYLHAGRGADRDEALVLRRQAGAQLLRVGLLEPGLALTGEVLRAQGLSVPASPLAAVASIVLSLIRLRLRGLAFRERPAAEVPAGELARIDALISASIGLAAIDTLRATELMQRALLRALDAGEPHRVAVGLGFSVAYSGNGGGGSERRTRALMAAADALSLRLGTPYERACALGGSGIAHFHLGEWARAQRLCEDAAELLRLRCPGNVKEVFTNELFALAAVAQQGHLAELARRLPPARRLAEERGDRYAVANLRTGLPNLAWLAADDVAGARRETREALEGLPARGYLVQHFFDTLASFRIALYEGDGEAATAVLAQARPRLRRSLLSRTEWIRVHMAWMEGQALLVSAGPRLSAGRARQVLGWARTISARRRPWAAPLAQGLEAAVAQGQGAPGRAGSLLEQAREGFTATGQALHAYAAEYAAARVAGGEAGHARQTAAMEGTRALGAQRPLAMLATVGLLGG